MSLYVCEECECVENTALGQYHARNYSYPVPYKGKKLCSECGSPFYTDGKPTSFGVWHDRFEKQHIDDYLKENPDSELKDYKSFK